MNSIFDNKILEQPNDYDYLWRFIKPSRIETLLKGEIYFPSLFQYDDYLESISPLHHFLISIYKRLSRYDIVKWSKSKSKMENYFARMEMANIEIQLKTILEIDDTTSIWKHLIDNIENIKNIEKEHLLNQQRTFASCWFIGDKSESALMWSSYSESKGIAIRIRFDKFKKLIESYFNNHIKVPPDIIGNIYAGKVKYHDFSRYAEWMLDWKLGRPLAFFKHKSFSQENEYRILIDLTKVNKEFNKSHQIINHTFFDDINFILHPSSNYNDLEQFRKKFVLPASQVITFSDLTFRQNL